MGIFFNFNPFSLLHASPSTSSLPALNHVCLFLQNLLVRSRKGPAHQLLPTAAQHIAWDSQEALFKAFACVKIITLPLPYKLNFLHKHKMLDSIWQTQHHAWGFYAINEGCCQIWTFYRETGTPNTIGDRSSTCRPVVFILNGWHMNFKEHFTMHCIKEFKSGVAGIERQTFPFAR